MELWAQVLLEVGGPVGVVIFMIVFGRDIISKLIEQSFQSASEKVSMCYSDNLARHSKAYELLLNKEFDFYEQTSQYSSDLIVDIQDICAYLQSYFQKPDFEDLFKVRELCIKTLGNIPKYKSNILIAQSFIPTELYKISSDLVSIVQSRLEDIACILKNASSTAAINEESDTIKAIQDDVLINCAFLMSQIKSRVEFLSK